MKKLFILFTLLLQLLSPIYPQQAATVITPSLKYGKPSKEELLFTTYTPDTTATALYLFHQGQSDFTYHDGFQLITEHWIRIKILKPQPKLLPRMDGSGRKISAYLIRMAIFISRAG